MFSFFKKKKKILQEETKIERNQSSNSDELNTKKPQVKLLKKSDSAKSDSTQQSSNSSSATQSPQIQHLSSNNSSNQQQLIQQKIFIEYTVQNEERLDDICEKFNMDKQFLMEINQIFTEDEEIPQILVVQATPIQQTILMNHAIKDETIQIIEKNINNIQLSDDNNISSNNDFKDTQNDIENNLKQIEYFASLEKNEEFPMRLMTENGIIKGILSINSFMVQFSPETKDYKRLIQNQIDLTKKNKQYKNHKFENNSITDYSVTLDINDIFMADINIISQSQSNLNIFQDKQSSKSKNNKQQQQENESNKMLVQLDIFMNRISNINNNNNENNQSNNNNKKQFYKVEFISQQQFESNDESDPEDIGRTYVHYILQKLQYLIGKSRSVNETVQQFTDNFTVQPSQSIVKHYIPLSCDSLHLLNLNADILLSDEINNPPKLDVYPSFFIQQQQSNPQQQQIKFESILIQSLFEQIVDRLPCYLQMNDWNLIYCPIKHGYSYDLFLKKCQNIGPHIIIIRDVKNKYIFGAFVTEGWQKRLTSYGSGESFLFSFKKNPDGYQRVYQNIVSYSNNTGSTHMQLCNDIGLAIGIDTKFALFIHHSLHKGTTHSTRLMSNDPLTLHHDFQIDQIEVWGLGNNHS